jgi:hypothetical protein
VFIIKQLLKENCNVSICSNLGLPLAASAKKLGINLFNLQEPPGLNWVMVNGY